MAPCKETINGHPFNRWTSRVEPVQDRCAGNRREQSSVNNPAYASAIAQLQATLGGGADQATTFFERTLNAQAVLLALNDIFWRARNRPVPYSAMTEWPHGWPAGSPSIAFRSRSIVPHNVEIGTSFAPPSNGFSVPSPT